MQLARLWSKIWCWVQKSNCWLAGSRHTKIFYLFFRAKTDIKIDNKIFMENTNFRHILISEKSEIKICLKFVFSMYFLAYWRLTIQNLSPSKLKWDPKKTRITNFFSRCCDNMCSMKEQCSAHLKVHKTKFGYYLSGSQKAEGSKIVQNSKSLFLKKINLTLKFSALCKNMCFMK